jgi:hypothetical protein
MLTGYGFESNQQLTDYTVYNNTGIFNVEEHPDTAKVAQTADSVQVVKTDTVKAVTPKTVTPKTVTPKKDATKPVPPKK